MSRLLVASIALAVAFAAAGAAGAREYRFFEDSDRVYYERHGHDFEWIVEPHIYLSRAASAFADGHRSYAAENLEKAAAGFSYFEDRAAGEDRRQLDRAGRALRKLARQVRRGDVDGAHIVTRAVADAERVLAGERVMETSVPTQS